MPPLTTDKVCRHMWQFPPGSWYHPDGAWKSSPNAAQRVIVFPMGWYFCSILLTKVNFQMSAPPDIEGPSSSLTVFPWFFFFLFIWWFFLGDFFFFLFDHIFTKLYHSSQSAVEFFKTQKASPCLWHIQQHEFNGESGDGCLEGDWLEGILRLCHSGTW